MKIRDKTVFVYDIEVFPNLFTCAVKNTESENNKVFEVSERKNDLPSLIKVFLNSNIYWCGYNNLHYDDPIINMILMNYEDLIKMPVWEICDRIKALSDTIIETKDNNFSSWSKYKYAHIFPSFDLLACMFSSKLRIGLKELQVTMNYHNVQEYDGDFEQKVSKSEIDRVIQYNENDINSTFELLKRLKKDIDLRLAIEDEYHINVLSKDGVNIGMEIIKTRYLQETGLNWNAIKDLRSPCDYLCLNDIIFDFIEFKTPTLRQLLVDLKSQCINPNDNSFERKFLLGDTPHTFALGGLHSINNPEIFEPDLTKESLIDWDVRSMYPSIILQHKVYPEHLGCSFLDVYGKIYDDRVAAKREGNKTVDATLKLALNGLSGNLQSEFSWVYSPKTALTIRINGQLMLLMLAEALSEIGVKIIQSNTDGIFCLVQNSQMKQAEAICHEWEKKTKLNLEADYFERFYQYAINDYLGVKKGWSETHDPKFIKTKGLFIDKVVLGKGMAPMIIPEAIQRHFVYGEDVETVVKNCTDILKFCTYQKVGKEFEVEYNGQLINHINRYYMSDIGYYMYKCKLVQTTTGKVERQNYISMCSSGVTLYNEFDNVDIKKRRINYAYYLNEIYKILSKMEVQQLSLF